MSYKYVKWFHEVGKNDLMTVGGKGANLGEMTQKGLAVPPGFCVTSNAYQHFIAENDLDETIRMLMYGLDEEDVNRLQEVSLSIQKAMTDRPIPKDLEEELIDAYAAFSGQLWILDPEVAVRSSATAEDLPDASFAGQQDTYLHISGSEELLRYVRRCWASLWTARAIYYREKQKFDHFKVQLSVVVQKMVNSEKAGVMFTANPINSNSDEIIINASWGLGEAVVSGTVSPDEYIYSKSSREIIDRTISPKKKMIVKDPSGQGTVVVSVAETLGVDYVTFQCLSDDEILKLVNYGLKIEESYGSVQDIEWAYDRDTKELYILQSRPITTLEKETEYESEREELEEIEEIEPEEHEEIDDIVEEESVELEETPIREIDSEHHVLLRGLPASPGIGKGTVKLISDISEISRIEEGDILVTAMTNPDMVPAMRKAKAVVTDDGGRTCHAAIVSRELGIPCIVGANTATEILQEGMKVTVDATRGVVYEGFTMEEKKETSEAPVIGNAPMMDEILSYLAPITATKIYMNLGEPSLIQKYKNLPFDGIGLMRTEFIFTNMIGAHPMYLVKTGQGQLLIDKMAEGIQTVAQEVFPRPIVVRLSDFRTNEFRGLKGGDEVEPVEANPMIGWRGVSRYISPSYEEGFRLECRALKKVREEFGLTNVHAMLPFVRTTWELKQVQKIMEEEGLVRNKNFKLWIMAEVPAVVFEAEEFASMVDGFSIGSNDLTQLVMGADRDSGILNNMGYFDERNEAVKRAILILIRAAHKQGITCSICGQGPSQYPELVEFLVEQGIDSMSVNPDTVAYTKKMVASVEKKMVLRQLRKSE